MDALDGLYRHRGAVITWDDAGVVLSRAADRVRATARWDEIDGARQIGGRPGYVQLLVAGHVPPANPRDDPFSIAVNSDSDANRLVTSIGWRTASESTTVDKQPKSSWLRSVARRG